MSKTKTLPHPDPLKRVTIYRSKMDWWVLVLVVCLLLALIAYIPMLIWAAVSVSMTIVSVLVLLAIILYICDIAFFTRYILNQDGLVIANEIRHLYYPYRQMEKIKMGGIGSLFSRLNLKRYALSSDCLVIYNNQAGWKRISISPVKKEDFLDKLLYHIDLERAGRVSIK